MCFYNCLALCVCVCVCVCAGWKLYLFKKNFKPIYLFICLFFKHLYWSIITLQWCVSFCFITKWISYTYTYVPISLPSYVSLPPTLPIPPIKVVTKHQVDLPVLCSCFLLAIYFTFGSVYMSMPLSPLSQLTLPPPHILKSIL